jgi:hypothetical protein
MTINAQTIAEVAAALTPIQIRALGELDDFYGRGPRHLSSNLQIHVSEARDILHHFLREGLVDYGSLFEEDSGLVNGRGYWLSEFGKAVRTAVGMDPETVGGINLTGNLFLAYGDGQEFHLGACTAKTVTAGEPLEAGDLVTQDPETRLMRKWRPGDDPAKSFAVPEGSRVTSDGYLVYGG